LTAHKKSRGKLSHDVLLDGPMKVIVPHPHADAW
jgi:hypothetical protein